MREIKFRGRDEDGQWRYGFLSWCTDVLACINDGTDWEVSPETVGQYTGAKDINGRESYEGDIIKFYDDRAYELVGVIKWSALACRWYVDCSVRDCDYHVLDARYAFEIIGNVYAQRGWLVFHMPWEWIEGGRHDKSAALLEQIAAAIVANKKRSGQT